MKESERDVITSCALAPSFAVTLFSTSSLSAYQRTGLKPAIGGDGSKLQFNQENEFSRTPEQCPLLAMQLAKKTHDSLLK